MSQVKANPKNGLNPQASSFMGYYESTLFNYRPTDLSSSNFGPSKQDNRKIISLFDHQLTS